MKRWLLIVSLTLAASSSGCIEGTCDWYGCEDLGGGFCVWYEGKRSDVVYIDAERYAEDGCNLDSAAPVFTAAHDVQHSERFVLFNERHTHHSEMSPGWGDRNDPRPTGIYHWIVDKEANNEWRHSGDAQAYKPSGSAIIGPLDSLSFVQEAEARGVEPNLVRALLDTSRDRATP